MELILNLNNYDYQTFLSSKVDTLTIGLNGFCTGYLTSYDLKDLSNIINNIHLNKKKVYLSLNIIANESTINNLLNIITELKDLNLDGFVISDFGFLQIFKEHGLINKVIFNPITSITNKYNASFINNMKVNHVCLANELNIKDLIDISNYNKGNVEILAQGYYQICNSKRPLLSNFFKKFKINSNSTSFKIKEESRDYAYPIIEHNEEVLIYIDKQRCILPYLKQLLEIKIKYLRIDTMFMNESEVNLVVDIYNKCINDLSLINENIELIQANTNSNLKCLDNISILKKEKNHD